MTEPATLVKLTILYMLDSVDYPLKKSQLLDFLLGEDFNTNYFSLMNAYDELIDSGYIESSSTHSSTLVAITPAGHDTLSLFKNRISEGIKTSIARYYEENKMDIQNELSVMSNYYLTSSGNYVAELTARDRTSDLMTINIYMPTEDSAKKMCENWKAKSEDIYSHILENLL